MAMTKFPLANTDGKKAVRKIMGDRPKDNITHH